MHWISQRNRAGPRRNRLVFLPVLLALGACSEPAYPPAPQPAVVSHFVLDTPNAISTIVTDPLPAKAARLKLPDGTALEADGIDRDQRIYSDQTGYGPGLAVGVAGGSSTAVSTSVGIGFPLFGSGGGVVTTTMTTSTLHFHVPDMEAYKRDWQRWILEIDLDDGVNRRVIQTLPPAPPKD